MGDPSWRFATTAGSTFRPEEISALILKRLRLDASGALGDDVTDAVITVPAYFDDAARRATIDAGVIAGLNVRRLLNELTAAALAYGMRGDHAGLVMVCDLGGGTFDVTVLRINAGRFDIRSTSGDRRLGGLDFDNALMQLLNDRFVEAGGLPGHRRVRRQPRRPVGDPDRLGIAAGDLAQERAGQARLRRPGHLLHRHPLGSVEHVQHVNPAGPDCHAAS
jgi:molecular chaperone DnaK (HSP70)